VGKPKHQTGQPIFERLEKWAEEKAAREPRRFRSAERSQTGGNILLRLIERANDIDLTKKPM
jgi:hypothetical protein